MFVMFSFHLSDCLVFRKKKKPHLWTTKQCCAYGLSVTNPPKTKWLETILFFFPLPHCSLAWAGLSRAVPVLSLVSPVRSAGWPRHWGGWPLSAGPLASPPCGRPKWPGQQGSWTAYVAAQSSQAIRQ